MNTDKMIFLSVVAITVLVVVGIVFASIKKPAVPVEGVPAELTDTDTMNMLENNKKVKGSEDAVLTIVEFADFECPYCKQIQPVLSQILDEYPSDIRISFMNFPLSFHKGAMPAALAAEAASMQGHFADYHDILFENQPNFSDEDLISYAKELNLDIDKFNADRASSEVNAKVKAYLKLGQTMQIRGTPTFFFVYNNSVELVNIQNSVDFKNKVDTLVASLKKKPQESTSESTPSEKIDN